MDTPAALEGPTPHQPTSSTQREISAPLRRAKASRIVGGDLRLLGAARGKSLEICQLVIHEDVFCLQVFRQPHWTPFSSETAFLDASKWRGAAAYDPFVHTNNPTLQSNRNKPRRVHEHNVCRKPNFFPSSASYLCENRNARPKSLVQK